MSNVRSVSNRNSDLEMIQILQRKFAGICPETFHKWRKFRICKIGRDKQQQNISMQSFSDIQFDNVHPIKVHWLVSPSAQEISCGYGYLIFISLHDIYRYIADWEWIACWWSLNPISMFVRRLDNYQWANIIR